MAPAVEGAALVAEIVRRHGAHGLRRFGSRARADATDHRDVDPSAVRPTGGRGRDAAC